VLWHCWLGVRKGIQPVKNWVVRYCRGCLSGARCKWFAYGPTDTTATLVSLKSRLIIWCNLSGAGLPRLSWKRGQWTDVCDLGYIVAFNKNIFSVMRSFYSHTQRGCMLYAWTDHLFPVVITAGAVANYYDEYVCVCVCVCLTVCPRAYLQNHMHDLYQFFCACCLWLCLGPPLMGWRNPKGKGQFWGCPGHSKALAILAAGVTALFAAKAIIQLPVTWCSRRDHSGKNK